MAKKKSIKQRELTNDDIIKLDVKMKANATPMIDFPRLLSTSIKKTKRKSRDG